MKTTLKIEEWLYELNNLGKNRNKILEKYRKTKALSI